LETIKKIRIYLIFILALLLVELTHGFLLGKHSVSVNTGFIFGVIDGNFLASIVSVSLLLLLFFYVRSRNYLWIPFIMIASGGIANVFDRTIYGGSQDYLNLWSIPTFNVPDIVIVFGGGWFLLNLLLHKNSPS